jgi:hypothetical protein
MWCCFPGGSGGRGWQPWQGGFKVLGELLCWSDLSLFLPVALPCLAVGWCVLLGWACTLMAAMCVQVCCALLVSKRCALCMVVVGFSLCVCAPLVLSHFAAPVPSYLGLSNNPIVGAFPSVASGPSSLT